MRPLSRPVAVAALLTLATVAFVALLVQLAGGTADPGTQWVRRAAAGLAPPTVSAGPTSPAEHPRPTATAAGPALLTASPAPRAALADSLLGVRLPGSPSGVRSTGAAAADPMLAARGRTKHAAAHEPARRAAHPRTHRSTSAATRHKPVHAPEAATRSHYLRHLTGRFADLPRMYTLGATDARRNASGQQHVVLLDVGGQTGGGVLLSTTSRWVSYADLARDVVAYVQGYHAAQRRHAPVTVAIGTNNDLQVSAKTGKEWAREVVQPVRAAAARFHAMTIAGANDIEPGFRAGPRRTVAWERGFLSATKAPLIFNGSADGCSGFAPLSRCGHGWRASELARVAGALAPQRISALPQVYNAIMARQWAMISLTAVLNGNPALRFHGPLTENAACRGEKHCPTMSSAAAWHALWTSLRSIPATSPRSLPASSDLDVH